MEKPLLTRFTRHRGDGCRNFTVRRGSHNHETGIGLILYTPITGPRPVPPNHRWNTPSARTGQVLHRGGVPRQCTHTQRWLRAVVPGSPATCQLKVGDEVSVNTYHPPGYEDVGTCWAVVPFCAQRPGAETGSDLLQPGIGSPQPLRCWDNVRQQTAAGDRGWYAMPGAVQV